MNRRNFLSAISACVIAAKTAPKLIAAKVSRKLSKPAFTASAPLPPLDTPYWYDFPIDLAPKEVWRERVIDAPVDGAFIIRAIAVITKAGQFSARFSDHNGSYLSNEAIASEYLNGLVIFPELSIPASAHMLVDIFETEDSCCEATLRFSGVKRLLRVTP